MKKLLTYTAILFSSSLFAKDFLPVDDAFKFDYIKDKQSITVIWTVANGYHLYKDKIKFTPSSVIVLSSPKGVIKNDEYLGKQEVLDGQVIYKLHTSKEEPINVYFQGCMLNELCYMPQVKIIN